MAEKRNTIFHNISNVLFGQSIAPEMQKLPPTGGITSTNTNRVLYSTNSKEDYERKLTQYKQQKLLSYQWAKAGADNAMESLAGYTAVKLMYRDSDLMDEMPEIGAALDLISEEACAFNADGEMVHVKSKSKRIKSILEDLFYERLNINVMLPMIARSMVKYGNEFMLLNIDGDRKNGVLGWKELPVYEMDRIENGYTSAAGVMPNQVNDLKPDKTVFVWVGRNESLPYQNWQVAHFRLLKNSLFLPYGCIVGDTRIETENGYKEIDSISIGDKVWTFDIEKQEKVLATVSMGMFKGIKDVYSVKTKHNFIEGTSDHKLLCYENNKLVYKEIQDIKIGNLLVVDNSCMKHNDTVKIDKSPLNENEANLKKYDIINRKNDGFKTEKVISNTYVGKKKTYDITVDNKNSNFFANGIVTHNCSHLHKARRAWRMWSMMEDGMLIYRLDKSIERRVFKVFVGAIDDQDVPAFIQEFANNFKRTPIIDPATGQVDLRKNFLDVSSDYFIPVRDPSAPTPIETLQSAQNPTAMDDIKYMQNKVFAALRVPKAFLNYEQAQGKGQNMSLLDIRFARMVNSMQQFLLLELNKIAMIHLFFMGLSDEITNFTLSMNNPSAQIEALELEDITKRIQTATAAVTDPGTGIPLMSMHKAMKKILKMSDAEIKDMFLEIRLEKAMAAELEQTAMIIKKTGIFDSVDRIYGDFNAMNGQQMQQQQQQDGMGGGAPGGASGGFEGGSLNMNSLGGAGTEDMPDMGGEESSVDMSQAPDLDNGGPMESKVSKPTLNEKKKERIKSFTERYFEKLNEGIKEDPDYVEEVIDFEGKNVTINEKVNRIFDKINNIIVENEYNGQDSLDDTGLTESAFDKDFYNEIENDEE